MTSIDQGSSERNLDNDLLTAAQDGTTRERAAPSLAPDESLRSERRLIRMGLDLHDGPLQDVVEIGMEVSLLARNLSGLLPEDETTSRILSQLTDVHARLFALERDLRELAYAADTPTVGLRPLHVTVAETLEEFERHGDIRVHARLDGEFDHLTPSQRIALLRILGEALTNARNHGGAGNVHVTITSADDDVLAEIVDDGDGFDVEAGLARAARRGRLGLLGMAERVRLLGGHFDIESRPGETKLTVLLRRYTGEDLDD